MSQIKVLLVDDDVDLLRLLSIRLRSGGYEIEVAISAEEALMKLPLFMPHVVVTDLQMSGMDGMGLFETINQQFSTLPVIILTAHGTIKEAVNATQKGVFGFLTKPFDSKELMQQIDDAARLTVDTDNHSEQKEVWRSAIVTRSSIMEDLLSQAQRIAKIQMNVFIHGASGTGKELLARAIHNASPRVKKPFIAVNCSAIPENLLESELFGHRKGAFTGATSDYEGLFRAANKGTLFLDEIGDMPKSFQAKLLRALQEMKIRAVGSTEDISVDVRIISATHINIDDAMSEGDFREDLYYRLNVVTLVLPSLQERREDIPLLANHFVTEIANRFNANVKGFSPEAMESLIHYDWPGNVRQLHNVVEQSVALSATPLIPQITVQKALKEESSSLPSLKEAKAGFEREYLIKLLHMTSGNVTQAAKFAKRNRTEFYRLLNRYHLDPATFKTSH